MMNFRLGSALLLLSMASLSLAGTITVKSPTAGTFLGSSNTLKFQVLNAVVDVTVRATVTGPLGTTVIEDKFSPNIRGEIDSSLPLNFGDQRPEAQGSYTIQVVATEPNATYNTVAPVSVTVDNIQPKFREFTPNPSAFVKGVVPIRLTIDEANVKDWRVRIGDQDIPGNTGSGNTVSVDWNTSGIENDGSQTISIRVRDLADNEATKTLSVTLDRIPPVASIQFPRSDTKIRPNSTVNVVVDVTDGGNAATSGSVDGTGIDIVAKRMDGTIIGRVTRTSLKSAGGNTLRWTGRLKTRIKLPSQFKIVATVVDRAGNVSTTQEVTVSVGR